MLWWFQDVKSDPYPERLRGTRPSGAAAQLRIRAGHPGGGIDRQLLAADAHAHLWRVGKLEAIGYVVGVEVTQEHLPDKRVYSVTPQGARALDAWLANPDPGVPRPRQPMLVKIFFGERLTPEQAAALLTQYRAQALDRRNRFAAAATADAAAVAADPDSRGGSGVPQRSLACGGPKRTSPGSTKCGVNWVCQTWGARLRLTTQLNLQLHA